MIKLSKIKANPNNPRIIKDERFHKLVKSLEEFPEMMEKRPMVCVTDPEDGKIYPIGGNMRLRALKDLKYKEVPESWVQMADNWTEEQRREFIIKDNVGFGEWDWDILANEWDAEELNEWGLYVFNPDDIDLDEFFEENHCEDKKEKPKIVLEYTQEDYDAVIEAFNQHKGSKEQIVFNLLGL